jgi:hypothetical protein
MFHECDFELMKKRLSFLEGFPERNALLKRLFGVLKRGNRQGT